ncbi:hypothetical protein ABIF65_004998 [Bradyrhizobium japonicum]|nr:hypothetical protein [Bradyrhizobium japonicum]MCP1743323.1 hypothetical protein [Bradyrhizobium japonicum]MCP1781671.1 hypothetical protein [Bradyrhizobium japonicum]MCP1861033.1 hypothetical protein [Bradyrhizobium japonicum]MCP1891797.1 hypothetical protein [Bradyrhizobium japonicum]MCP1955338.1 hypothetical protein [Bradyrhizobium japonicum]
MKVLMLAGHDGCGDAKLLNVISARGLPEWSRPSANIPGQKART